MLCIHNHPVGQDIFVSKTLIDQTDQQDKDHKRMNYLLGQIQV